MASRPIVLGIVLAGVAAAGAWMWRLGAREPLAEFRDFPWTYITEAATGPDETRVIIDRGSIGGPPSVVEAATGATAWPAYVHPDPAVVPLIGGKPCIFPVVPAGSRARTPAIPSLRRPLTADELAGARRYLTPEGAARMAAFREEMAR